MNRRSFIASLFALPAAVKAALSPRIDTLRSKTWTTFFAHPERHLTVHNFSGAARRLEVPWLQTSRRTSFCSISYLDQLDVIMKTPEPERKKAWHDHRKDRCRQSIAFLKTQRPLPLP
jgi:hypothetical protein